MHTGVDTDTVVGGVVAPGTGITNTQVEHFEKLMNTTDHVMVIKFPYLK